MRSPVLYICLQFLITDKNDMKYTSLELEACCCYKYREYSVIFYICIILIKEEEKAKYLECLLFGSRT